MNMNAPLIELTAVSKRFDAHVAVDHLSMKVEKGEIVALLGRTGAGKSTVMSLLMGTIACDEGHIQVAGVDPSASFQALRGKMSVSFQTDRLLPWRNACENVELGLLILNKPKAEARATALEWLRRVKLEGAEYKYASELSGGMRQRVSLARALAVDPDIVLLDEAFSQLDHVTSQVLRRDFAEIVRAERKTCVFVTHRIDDALEIADRVLVLAAPAQVCLEMTISAAQRADATAMAEMHIRVERAIGGNKADATHPQSRTNQ